MSSNVANNGRLNNKQEFTSSVEKNQSEHVNKAERHTGIVKDLSEDNINLTVISQKHSIPIFIDNEMENHTSDFTIIEEENVKAMGNLLQMESKQYKANSYNIETADNIIHSENMDSLMIFIVVPLSIMMILMICTGSLRGFCRTYFKPSTEINRSRNEATVSRISSV